MWNFSATDANFPRVSHSGNDSSNDDAEIAGEREHGKAERIDTSHHDFDDDSNGSENEL